MTPNASTRRRRRAAGKRRGRQRAAFRADDAERQAAQPMCSRCSPIPRGASTSATSATTRWATCSRAIKRMHGPRGAPPDGLGRLRHAGRERRDGKGRPPRRLDPRQYRQHEGAAQAARLRARLEPRAGDLRARLLRPRTGAVPRSLRRGAGLPQGKRGQLGPGRHDRARQRAGDRRPRLALGRAGREAQAQPVVPEDHRLRRRTARRARRASTAGPTRSG